MIALPVLRCGFFKQTDSTVIVFGNYAKLLLPSPAFAFTASLYILNVIHTQLRNKYLSLADKVTSTALHLIHIVCLLLLISMLWHRQAIFESKGDKLSSSAECRIRTQGLRHLFASRLNACWQTDWAIEDQATQLPNENLSLADKVTSTALHLIHILWIETYWKCINFA